jgi:hypothetical protein
MDPMDEMDCMDEDGKGYFMAPILPITLITPILPIFQAGKQGHP